METSLRLAFHSFVKQSHLLLASTVAHYNAVFCASTAGIRSSHVSTDINPSILIPPDQDLFGCFFNIFPSLTNLVLTFKLYYMPRLSCSPYYKHLSRILCHGADFNVRLSSICSLPNDDCCKSSPRTTMLELGLDNRVYLITKGPLCSI